MGLLEARKERRPIFTMVEVLIGMRPASAACFSSSKHPMTARKRMYNAHLASLQLRVTIMNHEFHVAFAAQNNEKKEGSPEPYLNSHIHPTTKTHLATSMHRPKREQKQKIYVDAG
jgi:hypothetical protein